MYVPGLPKTQAFMNQLTRLMQSAVNDPELKQSSQKDTYKSRLSPRCFKEELASFGFRVLGTGHYSIVLEPGLEVVHEQGGADDWVVKLGCDITDNWLTFAVYCMTNPAPWFPKVHKIAIYDKFYVVVTERLTTAHNLPNGWNTFDDSYTLWAKFVEAFPEARRLEEACGTPDDTHYQNFMWRGPQIVCTDPYHMSGSRLRPAPGTAYKPTVIDESNIRELATGSGELTAGVQQESNALRLKPFHEDHIRPDPRMGVLPQMRGDAAVQKIWSPKPVAARPVGRKAGAQDFIMAGRRDQHIHGRRADILVVDDVDAPRKHGTGTQRRLRNDVFMWAKAWSNPGRVAKPPMRLKEGDLRDIEQRMGANFVHAWDAAFLNAALAPRGPGQEKVCDERPLADWEAFPLPESPRRGPKAKRAKV